MSAQKNASSKSKFYDQIINALTHNFSSEGNAANERIGCMVVGSPGFTRENFYNYMKAQAERK